MKFGKSLIRVIELSDPEWGPYWINYKLLKKKIKAIVRSQGGTKITSLATHPSEISKKATEVEFFTILKNELRKTSDFFASTEKLYAIRKVRVWEAFNMLKDGGTVVHDKNTWTRLLQACVNFYKDVLLLENFAIMSYCGFSKILKKHDKMTGYMTREAYMRNVVNRENFTHYPYVMDLIHQSEKLFADIQSMESVMPLQDEERLFIEAIRDLNYQASRLQSEQRRDDPEDAEPAMSHHNETMGVGEAAAGASEVPSVGMCGDADPADVLAKRSTSFNPYHGPSFITAIPDSSTPYISGMCVVDPGDRLDAATSLAIDAALRLRHSSAATATAPSLHSIVSLHCSSGGVGTRSPAQTVVGQKRSVADSETALRGDQPLFQQPGSQDGASNSGVGPAYKAARNL